jgi:hypothetical protein
MSELLVTVPGTRAIATVVECVRAPLTYLCESSPLR